MSRRREFVEPNADSSPTRVILSRSVLDALTRRHGEAANSASEDYIFGTATGTALNHLYIGKALPARR